MSSGKAILVHDVTGTKYNKSLKRFIPGSQHSSVNVLRGELVSEIKPDNPPFNYVLSRDPNVYLFCTENEVAPLSSQDFLLLEAISEPYDRIDAFNNKLEWGAKLEPGASVYVTAKGPNLSVKESVRAVLHYKGEIGNIPGIQFGVEILHGTQRKAAIGTTDGTFKDTRYFQCEDGCGLFVPLHLISPADDGFIQNKPDECEEEKERNKQTLGTETPASYSAAVTKGEQCESSVDPPNPSVFRVGQRVMFHDKNGDKFYGVVKWTGREDRDKKFGYPIVGIKTDEMIFLSDFESSIRGISHLMKSFPLRNTLFLPEGLVDELPSQTRSVPSDVPCDALNMSPEEIKEQKKALERAKKNKIAKEDHEKIAAMKAAEESVNLPQQQEAYRKLEAAKRQNNDQSNTDFHHGQLEQQRNGNGNFGSGQGKVKRLSGHLYEHVRDPKELVEQHRPLPNRPGSQVAELPERPPKHGDAKFMEGEPGHPADSQPERFALHQSGQRNPQLHDTWQAERIDHGNQREAHEPASARQDQRIAGESGMALKDQYDAQRYCEQGRGQEYIQQRDVSDWQDHGRGKAQIWDQTQQYDEHYHTNFNNMEQRYAPYHADVRPQGNTASGADYVGEQFNLTVGSLIQIDSPDPQNPRRYGTIKWIGTLPNVRGRIAGIELDEYMDGCTDGTYQQTKQKFFSCPYGKGLYYPLETLQPDERLAPVVAADGNPLRKVSEEELTAPVHCTPQDYIGDERGIQGHQNSCYLDATLFGLFALTNEFDTMFLPKTGDSEATTIGNILWKNIVNPLRKNGVVKYECVMKLRKQLDQLGKMKGITQDEKDPEEFLNMMFKHTLQVEPFISIRRPFGVEKEFFVQLFLDIDEAQKLPTVGDLVNKMFSEQQISFTEVPSKLLVQVPRFGKSFQTFRKVIPAKYLDVARNIDMKNQLECYNCQEAAYKTCQECAKDYGGNAPAWCDKCLKSVHKKARQNHRWEWCEEMKNIQGMAQLELLSVICIETSHYVCFARQEKRWIFFDSMANRVYDQYNIPKVVDCTDILNEWVYPEDGDLTRLLKTPPRELPEYVRRFTQDIYMCVYIQPDLAMYG